MARKKTQPEPEPTKEKKVEEEIEEPSQEETPEQEEEQPQRRYQQTFQSKDDEEYIQKLENAYSESTAEGLRLNQRLKEQPAPQTPQQPQTPQAPLLPEQMIVLDRMVKKDQSDWNDAYINFTRSHPEMADPTNQQRLTEVVGTLAQLNLPYDRMLDMAFNVIHAPTPPAEEKKPAETKPNLVQQRQAEQGSTYGTMPGKTSPKAQTQPLTAEERAVMEKTGLNEEQYREG